MFYDYFGDGFTVEYPVNSGRQITLKAVADELSHRLISLFTSDSAGKRPALGLHPKYQDPHFRDNILFILFREHFDGDDSRGVGPVTKRAGRVWWPI